MLVVFRPRTPLIPPREQTDSRPLRRSARLIAKQQRLNESRSSKEDPNPNPKGCSTRARSSQSSLDCSVKEVGLKEPPHTSERESTRTEEKTKPGSRKRKRSSSPKQSSVSQPPELPTRSGTSHNTPFTRPAQRRRSTKSSLEPSQTTVEIGTDSATNISESDSKSKSSAKRRRTSRGTATDTSSRLSSTSSGKNPSHNRSVTQPEKQEGTSHSRGSGKSQRGSSSDKRTRKGKTKKGQHSSFVEELDESTKKSKRRKEPGKGSVETEGGELDPHGRRAVRESVIRDPTTLKGKGQTTSEKSSKGKGRARTDSLRYRVHQSSPIGHRANLINKVVKMSTCCVNEGFNVRIHCTCTFLHLIILAVLAVHCVWPTVLHLHFYLLK